MGHLAGQEQGGLGEAPSAAGAPAGGSECLCLSESGSVPGLLCVSPICLGTYLLLSRDLFFCVSVYDGLGSFPYTLLESLPLSFPGDRQREIPRGQLQASHLGASPGPLSLPAETSSLGIFQRQESIFQHFPGQVLESPWLRLLLPKEKQQLSRPLLQTPRLGCNKAVGQSGSAPDSNPDVRPWHPCLSFPIVKHGSTRA